MINCQLKMVFKHDSEKVIYHFAFVCPMSCAPFAVMKKKQSKKGRLCLFNFAWPEAKRIASASFVIMQCCFFFLIQPRLDHCLCCNMMTRSNWP